MSFEVPTTLAPHLRILFGDQYVVEQAHPPSVVRDRMSQTLEVSNAEGRHAVSFSHDGMFQEVKITGVLTTEYFK